MIWRHVCAAVRHSRHTKSFLAIVEMRLCQTWVGRATQRSAGSMPWRSTAANGVATWSEWSVYLMLTRRPTDLSWAWTSTGRRHLASRWLGAQSSATRSSCARTSCSIRQPNTSQVSQQTRTAPSCIKRVGEKDRHCRFPMEETWTFRILILPLNFSESEKFLASNFAFLDDFPIFDRLKFFVGGKSDNWHSAPLVTTE